MRVALLTCDQPWQRTLAMRLASRHELVLVVVDPHASLGHRASRLRSLSFTGVVAKSLRKLAALPLDRRDARVYREHFVSLGAPPFESQATTVLYPSDINLPEIASRLTDLNLDLAVVSGTRIIKDPVLSANTRHGLINLHTGLSPYYRGGPCTFWCLHNREPEYAGATVHHLSAGVDSGDIVLSRRAGFSVDDGVASLDARVIEMGHKLVLDALDRFESNTAPRIPQWSGGRVYRFKQFTPSARWRTEALLKSGLLARSLERLERFTPPIRTVDADD